MENVVLCEGSALEFYRRARHYEAHKIRGYGRVFGMPAYYCASAVMEQSLSRGVQLQRPSYVRGELEALAEELELSLPLHLLFPSAGSRRHTAAVYGHAVPAGLSERCAYRIGEGVYVCRPELMLLQLAQQLDDLDLVRLISELTSCFVLDESTPHGQIDAPALVERRHVERFCSHNSSVSGTKRLARLNSRAVPNTGSPMELVLALLLTLPYSMGGYGLPAPEANRPVSLTALQQHVSGTRERRGDLVWQWGRLAVEYDSDQEHLGSAKLLQDTQRRNAMQFKGYAVITVTRRQLRSIDEMDKVAINIAKQLGRRIRPRRADWCFRQEQLFERLLGESTGYSRRVPSVIAR